MPKLAPSISYTAIIAITLLAGFAIHKGHDGATIYTALAAIATIGGATLIKPPNPTNQG